MQPSMIAAIAQSLTAPPTLPDPYEFVDAREEGTWIEKANFRLVNARQKAKKWTRRNNETSGEFYASRAFKRDHPYNFHPGIVNLPK